MARGPSKGSKAAKAAKATGRRGGRSRPSLKKGRHKQGARHSKPKR